MNFSKFELDASLLKGIKELGFSRPTPIQSDAIPPAMQGKDLLACASTGSGKTAAFALPILHKLIARSRRTTRALIITPTRELALQIVEQLDAIAVHTPVTAASIIGGVGMGPQEHAFRSGTDILVATPGRLLDHMKAPYAKLDHIEFLVLDEADRMLDMGFLPDIRKILKALPTKRQTLFFSATMPKPIAILASEMLKHPATINLERTSVPATGITQALYPVPQELKSALFLELLTRGDMKEALVFTRTAPGEPPRGVSRQARHKVRENPRQPLAKPAHGSARWLQEREVSRARGDRHCRTRHRCRGTRACGELRCTARSG